MLLYEKRRSTVTVRLEGELDHGAADKLRPEVDALIMDPSVNRLVLDLSALDFMDSAGVGFVIGRYKAMARRVGSVAVTGADRAIDRIFTMSGLYQIVERLA